MVNPDAVFGDPSERGESPLALGEARVALSLGIRGAAP